LRTVPGKQRVGTLQQLVAFVLAVRLLSHEDGKR
jgi:hypothetical protein